MQFEGFDSSYVVVLDTNADFTSGSTQARLN